MSGPARVVQYWAGYPRSPNSKWQRFLAIIRRCHEEGWRNYLVWSRMPEDPALVEPFRKVDCEIILHPCSRGNFDLASIWRTYRLLRQLRCDVFHCYNDHTSPLISAALARVPVRIWSKLAMSSHYERGIPPKGLHRLALSSRISCVLSTRVLARSQAVRQELLAEGITPERILVTPVDVDISLYGRAPRSALRSDLGYSGSNLIITSVGHAAPVKGWDVLLSSFQRIVCRYPEARLLLVGDIPSGSETLFAESLRRAANQDGVNDRVRFLGRRDDIPSILAMSDLFVLPSRSEGQPGALVEALATGLACVATRVGGIPEAMTDGQDGLLVDREDVGALTEAIGELIQDERRREEMGAHAKETAKRFDVNESTEKCFQLYANLYRTRGS